MKKKINITKLIFNNWAIKLFSVVAAFLLWLLVMNIDDPEDQKSFYTIPVKLVNTEILEQGGKVYEILDKSDTVRTVVVTAPKSVRDELSSSDIVAEADFNNLTAADTVEIRFYSLRYNDRIANMEGSSEVLKLNIENKKTKRLILSVDTTGTVEDGYVIKDISPDQNRIEISGPESVINRILSAKVTVDVTDSISNISTYANVQLYDVDGKAVDNTNIVMNTDAVRVKVEVLATKKVPIVYTVKGDPAEGYLYTGEITGTMESVLIAGTTEAITPVKQITIPEEYTDITDKTENLISNVNINNFLPEGISLAEKNFNGKLTITAYIEKKQSRELRIPTSNIRFTNIPSGYEVTMENPDQAHTVVLQGLPSRVDGIEQNAIFGYVSMLDFMTTHNMETLEIGSYEVEVKFNFADGIEITHPLKIQIKIAKIGENE